MSTTPTAHGPGATGLVKALLASLVLTTAAIAQTAPSTKDAVIKPPPRVDPAMQVRPKQRASLPTPVVKPPATVVPK